MLIRGKDQDEGEDIEDVPVRVLSDFCIFHPKSHQIQSLRLFNDETQDHNLIAAKWVQPVYTNEEDARQEDEDPENTMVQRLCTSKIFRYTVDYERIDE